MSKTLVKFIVNVYGNEENGVSVERGRSHSDPNPYQDLDDIDRPKNGGNTPIPVTRMKSPPDEEIERPDELSPGGRNTISGARGNE